MKAWAAFPLLLLLAACGGAPRPADTGTAPAKPAVQQATPQTAAIPQTAPEPQNSKPQSQRDTAPRKSAEPPEPAQPEPAQPEEPEIPVDDDPAQFLSAGPSDLRTALGDPVLIRRDGKAEVWQFRGDACTLDLFLYPGANSALTVKHVELRGEDADERRACLERLLRAQIVAADG